jgi:hypothetical protein
MPIASRLTNTGNLVVNSTIDELTNNPITFGSLLFDGSTGYLTVANNAAFNFGTGNFTLESFVYITGYPNNAMLWYSSNAAGTLANGLQFYITSSGTVAVGISAVAVVCTTAATVPLNVWAHLAVTRSGSNFTIWINGVSSATGTSANTITNPTTNYIGNNASSVYFNGYMSNFRVINGTALYTATFTPPLQPLTAITNTQLLLNTPIVPSTSAFLDSSTNAFTVTTVGTVTSNALTPVRPNGYYNYYFNNAGPDFIMASPSASYQLTGDFTIECWIYGIGTGSAQFGIVTLTNATSSGTNGLTIFLDTSSRLGFFVNGTSTLTYSTTNTILANNWYHIALARSGSTNTMYVNGLSVSTSAITPTWPATPSIGIGRFYNDNTSLTWNGYITNLRIVKGTAVYTANFTPQTSSLSSIPNTLLLTCQSNTIIDKSLSPITLTRTSGNAAVTSNTSPLSTYNYSGTGISVQKISNVGLLQTTGIIDEFTIKSGSVAQRVNLNGNLQLAGIFDEWTGAPVVDGSLMVWLDAGQPSSYSGSGATWTDLSGNGKNYTLSNGPTFNSGAKNTTGGTLTFTTASSQYATSASSLFNSTTYNTVTMNIWVYPTSSGNIIQIDGQAALATGYHASAIEITAAGVISFGLWTGSAVTTIATSTQSLNAWYNLVITYNGTTATAYVNGASVGSSNITWSAPGTSTFMALMAAESTGMGTNAYTSGNLGAFMVYNRSLTVDEVTSNYNALRRRYGR